MILRIRVENMKDATGEKKRVMFASLTTDIIGMERIDTVAELDERCVLGKEVTTLITNMLALKQHALKIEHKGKFEKKRADKKSK